MSLNREMLGENMYMSAQSDRWVCGQPMCVEMLMLRLGNDILNPTLDKATIKS